ncbi:MAG: chain-length determining protein [Bacteroidaceae bacterium]|nr:chain-length determining protein [Bacteroidaceae bacterium]
METKPSNMGLISAAKILLAHKNIIIRNCVVAGVVFAALILCVPRYYKCEVALAPEFDNSSASLGSFSSIASSLGINLGGGMNSDAISPSLYPDLINSKEFLVSLFDVKITTDDGKLKTNYYDYINKHQKAAWWTVGIRAVKRFFKNIFTSEDNNDQNKQIEIDPFRLNKKQYGVAEAISNKISCSVDPVNYIITISVTDQDPLVCASVADSVREHLQLFITRYRTGKARNDMEYYQDLMNKAKQDYDKAINAYSAYSDSHKNIIMQSYISQRDELENDMRVKFNIYTALQQQVEQAKARVQERTPAFTTLKCASVPIKPDGPKRVIYTLLIIVFTFFTTAFYLLSGKKILAQLRNKKSQTIDNYAVDNNVYNIKTDNSND